MNIEQKLLCRDVVNFNCKVLKINPVPLKFEPKDKFRTPTTRAAVSKNYDLIAVNKSLDWNELEIWFSLSHEARHLWQVKNGLYITNYMTADSVQTEKYNEQEAEIDAHAWAVIVVNKIFGLRPTLEKNLGADVWNKIEKRAEKILKDIDKI